jgi:hypothetical protein
MVDLLPQKLELAPDRSLPIGSAEGYSENRQTFFLYERPGTPSRVTSPRCRVSGYTTLRQMEEQKCGPAV